MSAETMQQKGMALGLARKARYQSLESELRDGEYIRLYTHGLIDAHNEQVEEFTIAIADRVTEG